MSNLEEIRDSEILYLIGLLNNKHRVFVLPIETPSDLVLLIWITFWMCISPTVLSQWHVIHVWLDSRDGNLYIIYKVYIC